MRIHAILLAGGSGDRFGAELPKQFVRLAGEPILLRSLRAVVEAGVDRVVIVAHPDWVGETEALAGAAPAPTCRSTVVAGGRDPQREHAQRPGAPGADGRRRHRRPRRGPTARAGRGRAPVDRADRAPAWPTPPTRSSPAPTRWSSSRATPSSRSPTASRYRRGQTPQIFRAAVLGAGLRGRGGRRRPVRDRRLHARPALRPRARGCSPWPATRSTSRSRPGSTSSWPTGCSRCGRSPRPTDPALGPVALAGARVLVVGGTNGIGQAHRRAGARPGGAGRGRRPVAGPRRARLRGGRDPRRAAAAERLGGLDHVVVTAGVLRIGRVDATDPADLAEVIDVNLTGSLQRRPRGLPATCARAAGR